VEKAYEIWRAFQDKFLARAAAFLLLGCTLLALFEVIRRYAFGQSFEWQQDAVTFFILSGVFLYFGIAQRRDTHLNVVLFVQLLEKAGPRAFFVAEIVKIVALCISFVFMIATVWWGIPEVHDSITYEVRTESLAFVLWPFLAALLVGFALMAVSLFFQIYREIQRLRGNKVLEEPPEEEVLPH
jgi:TRAP-type C4-dicarboxylate transport system permease small subunit